MITIRNKKLAGAKFELYDLCGRKVGCGVTDSNGSLFFPSLPYGQYVLREACPPCGYVACEDIVRLEISAYCPNGKITLCNRKNCGSLFIRLYGDN